MSECTLLLARKVLIVNVRTIQSRVRARSLVVVIIEEGTYATKIAENFDGEIHRFVQGQCGVSR